MPISEEYMPEFMLIMEATKLAAAAEHYMLLLQKASLAADAEEQRDLIGKSTIQKLKIEQMIADVQKAYDQMAEVVCAEPEAGS